MASKTTDLSGAQKNDVYWMQDMSHVICSQSATSNANTYTLVDRRENPNKSYLVSKIGNYCWMVQNLALYGNQTINHTWSNLETGKTFTLPVSSNATNGYFLGESSPISPTKNMFNGTHINGTENSTSNTGSYYTWRVTTMDFGTNIDYGNVTNDICPKNWRMVSLNGLNDGSSIYAGEYAELAGLTGTTIGTKNTNLTETLFQYFKMNYVGFCGRSVCSLNSATNFELMWTATTSASETNSWYIHYYSPSSLNFNAAYHFDKSHGGTIRCVAK